MQQPARRLPLLAALRQRYPVRYDAVALAVYIAFVFSWGLGVAPMGRDFANLAADPGELPFLAGRLIGAMQIVWGTWTPGYQLVNMALLYACMLAVYALVNYSLRGPLWLGALAAALFMANPVHTEAVLNVTGAVDILPALLALTALALYAAHVFEPLRWRLFLGLAVFAVGAFAYPALAFLWLVILLYERLVPVETNRHWGRAAPFAVVGLAGLFWNLEAVLAHSFDLAAMAAPAYLVFYCIGFLPSSAQDFHASPLLAWTAGAAAVAVFLLIYRKAWRPTILFAVLGMLAFRLYHGERPIDPVHLVGGGQLLVPAGLFALGLVALFYRAMDHPKWRVIIVWSTTTIAIVFFVLQIRVNVLWREAGNDVKTFQEAAAAHERARSAEAGVLGVLPAWQYMNGAPVMLTESIAYDTLFSEAIPAEALLPLHHPGSEAAVTVEEWEPEGGLVRVEGVDPRILAPWPYALATEGGAVETNGIRVAVERLEANRADYRIEPVTGALPIDTLPVRAAEAPE